MTEELVKLVTERSSQPLHDVDWTVIYEHTVKFRDDALKRMAPDWTKTIQQQFAKLQKKCW